MRIEELDLQRRFGGTITRVRRGDTEMLADPRMVLELGDRVRVVAQRRRLGEISTFFGDSYRALGEVDVLTFAAGLAFGLALGLVPFPFPGPGSFELGSAGRPAHRRALPRRARAVPARSSGRSRTAPT